MKFGPAEMAQTMDAAKALIAVTVVYSVGIGIVFGAVVALYRIFFRHHAADQDEIRREFFHVTPSLARRNGVAASLVVEAR